MGRHRGRPKWGHVQTRGQAGDGAVRDALTRIGRLEASRDLTRRQVDELELWRAGMVQVLRDALGELGVTVPSPETPTVPSLRVFKGGRADERAS